MEIVQNKLVKLGLVKILNFLVLVFKSTETTNQNLYKSA